MGGPSLLAKIVGFKLRSTASTSRKAETRKEVEEELISLHILVCVVLRVVRGVLDG